MNKIEELLGQMGASPELTKQIMESLEEYKTKVKKELDEEFKTRMEKAKQLCVEEVEREKQEIARKVEVFLEARTATVLKEAQRQASIGDTTATKTLKGVKALVEGVEISGNGDQGEELKALRIQVRQLAEEKEKSELARSRATKIAMNVIERNKILESKIPQTETKKTVVESKQPGKTLGDLKRPAGEQRKVSSDVIVESVAKKQEKTSGGGDSDVEAIASTLDGTRAF